MSTQIERAPNSQTLLDTVIKTAKSKFFGIPDSEISYNESLFVNYILEAIEDLDLPPSQTMLKLIAETGIPIQEVCKFFDFDHDEFDSWDDMWKQVSQWVVNSYVNSNRPEIVQEEDRRRILVEESFSLPRRVEGVTTYDVERYF